MERQIAHNGCEVTQGSEQINGIHHSVSGKHLQRYCDESAFRFNNRDAFQDERFANALANCNGSLTYKQLIGKNNDKK